MKERPILFSAPMVRAILEGRKTQTRRIVKFPGNVDGEPDRWARAPYAGYGEKGGFVPLNALGGIATKAFHHHEVMCPYGQPGDRLWVRETHCIAYDAIFYRADGEPKFPSGNPYPPGLVGKWRPSIFMPRAASRITLEVTGVRVERLGGITEADARAEGIFYEGNGWTSDKGQPVSVTAVRAYEDLWHSINGSWLPVPWVWVVEFKRLLQ